MWSVHIQKQRIPFSAFSSLEFLPCCLGFLNFLSWFFCPEMGFSENVSLLPRHTMSVSGIPFNPSWPEKRDEKIAWIFPLLLVLSSIQISSLLVFRYLSCTVRAVGIGIRAWLGEQRDILKLFRIFSGLQGPIFLFHWPGWWIYFRIFPVHVYYVIPSFSLSVGQHQELKGQKKPHQKQNPKKPPMPPSPQTKTKTRTLPVVLVFLQISDSLFRLPAVVYFAKSSGSCFLDFPQSFLL